VYDECNTSSVGDIVEIAYKGKDGLNRSFKINQIIKESQKYTNPINGKNYSM
jgi:ribosomal protein S17